jgi:hypothetical protein
MTAEWIHPRPMACRAGAPPSGPAVLGAVGDRRVARPPVLAPDLSDTEIFPLA